MSRLADRMMVGCKPNRKSLMFTPEEHDDVLREMILREGPVSDDAIEETIRDPGKRATLLERIEQISSVRFEPALLDSAPIFAAEDVALYVASLPSGTPMDDIFSSMAPPFDRFFVEFQRAPNRENLHAWGALVETQPPTVIGSGFDEDPPRWLLTLDTFLERVKGQPFGPVARHYLGLGEDGTWFRHPDGEVFWTGGLVGFEPHPPEDVMKEWGDYVAQLLFPVLLTISFMHAKNVQVETAVPPAKVSRKHQKKHGQELVRYHTLKIGALREILDRHRSGSRDAFKRALHICRGHFKTFTPDAPLLGRHVGTYWWAPLVRGSSSEGVVVKDYRVEARSELGVALGSERNSPADETRTTKDKGPRQRWTWCSGAQQDTERDCGISSCPRLVASLTES